jgi:hypothetical protein
LVIARAQSKTLSMRLRTAEGAPGMVTYRSSDDPLDLGISRPRDMTSHDANSDAKLPHNRPRLSDYAVAWRARA